MVLSDQVAEAKVLNVLWSPSKDGYLKPRIQIEPVVLGGAKIEYATAFNAMGMKKAIDIANKNNVAIMVIYKNDDVIDIIFSDKWYDLFA